MVKKAFYVLLVCVCGIGHCRAEPRVSHLPARLSGSSMNITFEVGTTWHTVHGEVKDLTGRVWFESPKDPGSIRATLTIPVIALDTGSESRDEEMRNSMNAELFPSIQVEMPRISPSCDVRTLTVESACTYATKGTITIRDVTLPLELGGSVHRDAHGALLVDGSAHLDWSAFGVKDPSILIAQVNEEVNIAFTMTLPEIKKSL